MLAAVSALTATSCAGILGFERLEEGGGTDGQEAGALPEGSSAPPSDTDATTSPGPDAVVPDGGGSSCPPPANDANDANDADDASCGYAQSVVYKGRCYFVTGGLLRPGASESVCESEGGTLATFTCADEWLAVRQLATVNLWINASYNGSAWVWNTGEAFQYFAPNASFDGGAPPSADQTCLWVTQSSEWIPVDCSASSGEPLCERGPLAR
jgi:hypothetical protein